MIEEARGRGETLENRSRSDHRAFGWQTGKVGWNYVRGRQVVHEVGPVDRTYARDRQADHSRDESANGAPATPTTHS
jgi:hypothetical protein